MKVNEVKFSQVKLIKVELASGSSIVAKDLIHDSDVNGLSWIKLSELNQMELSRVELSEADGSKV